ncbi:MAG: ABC transporter permease [Candidatus Korobacteraceae bacterium]
MNLQGVAQSSEPVVAMGESHLEPIVVQNTEGRASLQLRSIWEYRELLYFFIWRDIKVRYKQTALGASWAIIQPVFTMVIFSIFFGRLAKMPSDGVPYPLFAFTALVPWTFFSNGVSQGSRSLVTSGELVKKIYFPRLIVPIAAVCAYVLDFILALALVFGMLAYYGRVPSGNVVWLPLLFLLTLVAATGISMWLSAMYVQYRDIGYVLPFLLQVWLFVTPIAYPTSLLSERWQTVYALNPMVGAVEGFRWALLGNSHFPATMLAISVAVSAALLVGGVYYFRHLERTFADVV